MTNIEFVSQITGILNSSNKDNKIPKRLILKVGQDMTTFLIAQKLMDRTILSETNLFTRIPCIEFEKIETVSCPSIEFRMCKILMKSIKPLPKLIFSRLGSSIKEIISVDGDFTFILVDEAQYRRNKKRNQQLKNIIYIYLGTDNHLYIPDREILTVDATVITVDSIQSSKISACTDGGCCNNNWTYNFICPDKLLEAVKEATIQKLLIRKQIHNDQNPNGVEGN